MADPILPPDFSEFLRLLNAYHVSYLSIHLPIPPTPICAVTSYGPRRVPGVRAMKLSRVGEFYATLPLVGSTVVCEEKAVLLKRQGSKAGPWVFLMRLQTGAQRDAFDRL